MNYEDIRTSDYEIGLSKLVGKKIKEVHGYLTSEFGEATFRITSIEFEDSTKVGCEGEHDLPYLVDGTYKFDEELLERLYDEELSGQ